MSNPYGQSGGVGYYSANNGIGVSLPTQAPPTRQPPGVAAGAATRRNFDAERVVEAGGDFGTQIQLRALPTFERLWRRLPEEGMFSSDVSPSNPFTFELGAFTVPQNMALMVFNMRPDVYRFSGVDPGDYMPIEARRLGSIMGFELTVEQEHQGNIDFQIDPIPIQRTSQQAFQSSNLVNPQANATAFAIAAAGANANTQGSSSMILPQRPERYGAPAPLPFTVYVMSNQTIQARCSIFRPVPIPIAFIEFDLTGYLVPETFANNLQEAYKYPQNANEESMR
jgi:hypothetical protein